MSLQFLDNSPVRFYLDPNTTPCQRWVPNRPAPVGDPAWRWRMGLADAPEGFTVVSGRTLFEIEAGSLALRGQQWGSLDDVVMGGVSESIFRCGRERRWQQPCQR